MSTQPLDLVPEQDAPPAPTTAWAERFRAVQRIEVTPGFVVQIKHLGLLSELAAGTLPNEVLNHLVQPDDDDAEMDPAVRAQERFQAYIKLAARAMVYPKLILPHVIERRRRPINYLAGEIAVSDLHYLEVQAIYHHAVLDCLPPVSTAPIDLVNLTASGLTKLGQLARTLHQRPSALIDLTSGAGAAWRAAVGDDTAAYWLWCIDEAALHCAFDAERRQREADQDAQDGRTVFRVKKKRTPRNG